MMPPSISPFSTLISIYLKSTSCLPLSKFLFMFISFFLIYLSFLGSTSFSFILISKLTFCLYFYEPRLCYFFWRGGGVQPFLHCTHIFIAFIIRFFPLIIITIIFIVYSFFSFSALCLLTYCLSLLIL